MKKIVPIFLIVSVILINIISICLTKKIEILSTITSIVGIIGAALSSKGCFQYYYFSFVSTVTYIIIAFNSHFYGSALFQTFFYIPMIFLGMYNWSKNLKKNTSIINTKKLELNKFILLILIYLFISFLYSLVLNKINNNLPFIDAVITIFSIIATILAVKRYNEQWLFWIIINIITIYMWLIAYINHIENSFLIAATWVLYLINSIYGYFNWKKLIKNNFESVIPTAVTVAYPRIFTDIPYSNEIFSYLKNKIDVESYLSKDILAVELEARYKLMNKLLKNTNIKQVLELAAGYSQKRSNIYSR